MKATIGGDFENPEIGTENAVLYSIVDIGTQVNDYGSQRQIIITWELDQAMDDGRPFVISKFYKLSLHEKANLCIDIEGMLGRTLTQNEKETLNFEKLLGFPCQVHLAAKTKKNGNETVVAKAFMPMKKGDTPKPLYNAKVFFDLDAFDQNVYDNLPDWQRERVNLDNATKKGKPTMEDDDEIPFGQEGEEVPDSFDPFD